MQVSIFGSKYTLPIAFRLSADAKGDNLLIGRQSQSALRPCPCCFLPSREFSNPNYLHCDESALPKMSELRSQLQTQLSQTLPDSADALWQAGATTMSIIASQPSTWTRASQKPLRAVLQLPFLRVPIEHLLSDANEAVALLLDNDISGKHCDVEEVQPGKLKWHASPEANLVSQWLQANAGERHGITQKLVAMDCGLRETLQPGGSMQTKWYKVTRWPKFEGLFGLTAGVGDLTGAMKGLVMNLVRPSLTRLIQDPAKQIVIEVLHCVLNQVKNHLMALKLLTNKYLKGGPEGHPLPKAPEEVASWKSPMWDNTTQKKAWRTAGFTLETDIKKIVGFDEPMMGYHGNQCFKLLEKVEELANLPALRLIDDIIRPEEPGAVREWLQALSVTLYQSRKSQPCCAELRRAITTWFAILTLPAVLEVYDLKTYDHFCTCHLIPQIQRNSNLLD
jgi:hypothetical protein